MHLKLIITFVDTAITFVNASVQAVVFRSVRGGIFEVSRLAGATHCSAYAIPDGRVIFGVLESPTLEPLERISLNFNAWPNTKFSRISENFVITVQGVCEAFIPKLMVKFGFKNPFWGLTPPLLHRWRWNFARKSRHARGVFTPFRRVCWGGTARRHKHKDGYVTQPLRDHTPV